MIRPVRRVALVICLASTLASAASAARVDEGGGTRSAGALAAQHLARLGATIYCGGRRGRLVALTFDDGPGPNTPRVLRVLRRLRARATFFVIEERARWWPRVVQAEAQLGAVGSHTRDHRSLASLRGRALARELASHRRLFRPPYGVRTRVADELLHRRRMLQVLWDVDPEGDGGRIRPGSIVLLHDTRPEAAVVTARLVRDLRRRGLRPVSVPELLAHDPPRLVRDPLGGVRSDCR
jgi:peptidoglycan-N-acetylglucosamine deacetylase